MKKLTAWILTLCLLLSTLGAFSVAMAAEAARIELPEPAVSVDKAGNVSVKIEGAPATLEGTVSFYKDGSYTYVDLTYDKAKQAFVGQDAGAVGGTVNYVSLSHSEWKYNEDYTEAKGESTSYWYSYSTSGENAGKLSYAQKVTDKNSQKRYEYEYTDPEGQKYQRSTWFTTSGDRDEINKSYSNGKLSYESNTRSLTTGDEKAQTVKETRDNNSYYRDDGSLSSTGNSQSETSSNWVLDENGWYNTVTTASSKKAETEYYDSEGAYTGKNVTDDTRTYDKDGNQTARDYVYNHYNANDVLTSKDTTDFAVTYNAAKDVRTEKTNDNTDRYSSKGLFVSNSQSEDTDVYRAENDSWKRQSNDYTNTTTLRNGNVDSTYVSHTDYAKDGGYTTYETRKDYNTYTNQLISELIYTEKNTPASSEYENATGYKTEWNRTYTQNNDDGSQRYKYVEASDGTETNYNKDGAVVATRDKEGTWKDGSGKVLGKNYSDENGYEYTYVYFKDRDGEIESYSVSTQTSKDGNSTNTYKYYKGSKLETETVENYKKNNVYERYENGVLREKYYPETYERRYYDAKGNLARSTKRDPEKGITTYYDAKGRKTEEYDWANDKDTYYDAVSGKMTSFDQWNSETGRREYYDADSKLTYSRGYEYKDGVGSTIYYGKDGKEFARTFNKYDNTTRTSQEFYDEWENGVDSYGSWALEENKATLEKVETTESTKGKTYTETENYTKWNVVDGKEQDKVTRKEETVRTSSEDGSETNYYKDGVLAQNTKTVYDDYDNTKKITATYYNWYTGKQTGIRKSIYSSIPDDPMSYWKRYDRYGNLQRYSETDNTDGWNWEHSYYADGTPAGEYWYDGLDGESQYQVSYDLYGQTTYTYTRNGENSTRVYYNRDGSYSSWAETENGVTNTWLYDKYGTLTGYKWNETRTDDEYSYEMWDEDSLLYKYTELNSDNYGWTRTDDAGNKLEYSINTDWETKLTLADSSDGWHYAVGEWFYVEDGEAVKNAWRQLGGAWYYFAGSGAMETGITPYYDSTKTEDNETTYAIDKDGVLSGGGWTEIGEDVWAYADPNGVVQTGWQQIGGQWYYFTDGWTYNETDYKADANWTQSDYRGAMVTGAVRIWNSDWTDKHTYFFNEDGTWDNSPGWKVADNFSDIEYHYYDENGKEVTGWKQIGGDWFYFNQDGVMMNGWVDDGGKWYFLDPANDGAWTENGWANEVYEDWYYIENGQYVTGWKQINGTWYYMDGSGRMVSDKFVNDGGSKYFMEDSGAMAADEWVKFDNKWYYQNSDGTSATDWKKVGDNWYYMDSEGVMQTGEVVIDGVVNIFDENGVWQGTK